MKLICAFVFAYAKIRFSHDAAHIIHVSTSHCFYFSGHQGRGTDSQKVEKEKENAKTKEQSEGKLVPSQGSSTNIGTNSNKGSSSSTNNGANPQVEFSLQSGPNSPRYGGLYSCIVPILVPI